MARVDQAVIIRAKHLIPRPGEEVENGAVALAGDRIVAAGRAPRVRRLAGGRERDLARLLAGL